MTAGALVRRALAVAALKTAVETALLCAVAVLLELQVVAVNAALLSLATSLLGAVWAARQALRGSAGSPCLAAALVPWIACGLFVAPRLFLGPAQPALATLAVLALVAPPVERAWSRFVLPADRASMVARSAMLSAAPAAAVALLAAAKTPAALVLLTVPLALGAIAVRRAARARAEARALAAWIGRIDVGPELAEIPPGAPTPRDPELAVLAREVVRRVAELGHETRASASARDEIADARALRTRFMAAMSHELRSPLNSIVGFAQLLGEGLEGQLTAGQRENVEVIRKSAEELIRLLTDILDLARLEAGRLVLSREWTPSVVILTDAVRLGRSIVEGREVEIEAELQPGLPPVHVDRQRIVQAVVALFRNAATSLAKTRIRLRARIAHGPPGPERHLRVEIHDAVGAIPPDQVERIFEAFQEISVPTGRRVGGLGMALTLSRGVVRAHGGEVWADSVPGAGTVLCVAIPLEGP